MPYGKSLFKRKPELLSEVSVYECGGTEFFTVTGSIFVSDGSPTCYF
jgi:hypothetical protein